jgi:hypothetical protein
MVIGLAANENTILITVDRADSNKFGDLGLFRSSDGGTSFTRISGASGTGSPFITASDVVGDPTNDKRYNLAAKLAHRAATAMEEQTCNRCGESVTMHIVCT